MAYLKAAVGVTPSGRGPQVPPHGPIGPARDQIAPFGAVPRPLRARAGGRHRAPDASLRRVLQGIDEELVNVSPVVDAVIFLFSTLMLLTKAFNDPK